jgi:DNA ligase (NAD+)
MTVFSIEFIKQYPEKYAKKESVEKIIKFLNDASNAYYNTDVTIVCDTTYDTIYEILKKRSPKNKFFSEVGADVSSDEKVKLPIFLGSQNKIKTEKELKNWVSKNECSNYILTPKIDGSSALLEVIDGKMKLYSRGNGTYGRDISHLAPYLRFPVIEGDMYARGELIVSKLNFKKFSSIFTSSRSMVNSLTSNKTINKDHIECLDFVVFELYDDLPLNKQLERAEFLGLTTNIYKVVEYSDMLLWEDDKSNYLVNRLNTYRQDYIYEIDGLIITKDSINPVNTSGNPRYSVAFKANNYGKVTTIKNIEWNVSKHGLMIPRIQIEPINLGSNIEYCTGYSAKYVFNNSLNKGAKVRVILSGEIIPTIAEVVTQGPFPSMPDANYKWDTNKVHIHTVGESDEQIMKKIVSFLKMINVENMGIGIVKKLYNNGYNSIKKILEIEASELKKIDGFEETLSQKIVTNIKKVIDSEIYLPLIMHGCCEFKYGFGIKKFEKVIQIYPKFMEEELTVEMLNLIPSFNQLSSEKFIENLPNFNKFLNEHSVIKYKLINDSVLLNNENITNKNVVFTGKRDKDLMEKVMKYKGIIQPAITKKTDYLVVDDISKMSVKIQKAKDLDVKILSKEDMRNFIPDYN